MEGIIAGIGKLKAAQKYPGVSIKVTAKTGALWYEQTSLKFCCLQTYYSIIP